MIKPDCRYLHHKANLFSNISSVVDDCEEDISYGAGRSDTGEGSKQNHRIMNNSFEVVGEEQK